MPKPAMAQLGDDRSEEANSFLIEGVIADAPKIRSPRSLFIRVKAFASHEKFDQNRNHDYAAAVTVVVPGMCHE
jgi:hypothetical protein